MAYLSMSTFTVAGYTLMLWLNFSSPVSDGEHVFMSNGGHSARSYGIAMLYDRGRFEFRFRRKTGEEWRVKSSDVLPGK